MLDFVYHIYEFISNGLVYLYLIYFMNRIFERKTYATKIIYYGSVIIFLIVFHSPKYIFGLDSIPYYYNFISLIVVSLIWSAVSLKSRLLIKLPYLFYMYAFYKCIKFIFSPLYEYQTRFPIATYQLIDMLSNFIQFGLLIAFAGLCQKHKLRIKSTFSNNQILLMLYCPFSFFVILQLADPSTRVPYMVFISISALLLMSNLPIIYYLYSTIEEGYLERMDLGKAIAQSHMQLARYQYTVLAEEQAKKERHEIKNKYFYIQTLLKENKLDQLDAYLAETIGAMQDVQEGIHTNNILIDHIINTQLQKAHRFNIKTYTEIIIPKDININENHFCTILMNLLDNAIEASQKENEPDIQIYINIRNSYLVCKIKNKVTKNVLEENPGLKTTKPDKKHHGLGMKIIRDSVKKADAIFDTSMESNYFVATVMMPIEQ